MTTSTRRHHILMPAIGTVALLTAFAGGPQTAAMPAPEGTREAIMAGAEDQHEPHRVELETSHVPSRGARDATVTISSFADFQCPFSGGLLPIYSRLENNYSGRLRFTFHQFPLSAGTFKAAEASLCAGAQDKFWEMHDTLFAQPDKVTPDDLKRRSQEIGLDATTFNACLDSGSMSAAVKRDVEAGRAIGVAGTPAIFVNGRPVALSLESDTYDLLSTLIDEEITDHANR